MSCTGETVLLSIETHPSWFMGKHSMLSEAFFTSPLVQNTVGQLMKIYCVARNVSTIRLALEGTTYLTTQFSNRANEILLQNFGSHSQERNPTENINHDLPFKNMNSDKHISVESIFEYGKTRLKELIEENTPEGLQESELMKILKSAVGLPEHKCLSDSEGVQSCMCSNEDHTNCSSISAALWHVAEERWKEATDTLFSYTPEKMIHSAIEMAQERLKKLMANSSLVSQISEAGDLLTTATQTVKGEAEILSQILCKSREHTLAGVTKFLNRYQHETTLETMYSLVNNPIRSLLACEGVELFSQYVWAMKPDFSEQDFLEANFQHIDDEGFHFMAEVQVPRRSILYIGAR